MAKNFNLKVEFEYSQIDVYHKNMLWLHDNMINFQKRFLETLANMIIQKVMPRTPVDTGRLRRSYKVRKVVSKGGLSQITVYNDAKSDGAGESYASFIELGHFTRSRLRWIEGTWMLTVSTDEVKAEMQRVWDKMFNAWIKENKL